MRFRDYVLALVAGTAGGGGFGIGMEMIVLGHVAWGVAIFVEAAIVVLLALLLGGR